MRWIRISVTTNDNAVDAVSAAMESLGTGGSLFEPGPVVIGFLPADDRFETSIQSFRTRLDAMPSAGIDPAPGEITLTFVDDEDWATAWRDYYKPIRITDRLTICPTWTDYKAETNEMVLRLDPGMAFGTGGHPTTRLCLRALETLLKGGETAADIGTGSGVLAIGAVLLGAQSVAAVDTDPVAVKVARENVLTNGMADTIQVIEGDRLQGESRKFDVVVANILPNVVRALAPAAFRALTPHGLYIVSGITLPHEPDVAASLADAGFDTVGRWDEEQWVALAARKP